MYEFRAPLEHGHKSQNNNIFLFSQLLPTNVYPFDGMHQNLRELCMKEESLLLVLMKLLLYGGTCEE